MGAINRQDNNKCPLCGEENIDIWTDEDGGDDLCYDCPRCGEFFAPHNWHYKRLSEGLDKVEFDIDKLKSYLFYHKGELRPYLSSQAFYEKLDKTGWVKIYNLTPEMVENWYPKTFSEKLDLILTYFHNQLEYIGQRKLYEFNILKSIYFIKSTNNRRDILSQISYVNDCLCHLGYISNTNMTFEGDSYIHITYNGLARIDSLQKTIQNNKQVFIAMSFDPQYDLVNDAIQKAITANGYLPRRMDEYRHNNQIVPEMLYQIKQSQFVVVDLTAHNNGAYYEAGYAAALDKPVILTCNEKSYKEDSHFDVKQQATVLWKDEKDLQEKLTTWITATVGKAK